MWVADFTELAIWRKKKPLKYITNSAEFMGMEFYIKEGVLVPRGDTEMLVHELLDIIKEDKEWYGARTDRYMA